MLKPLPPDGKSTVDRAPRSTWMFRGLESFLTVSYKQLEKLRYSKYVVRPASSIGLPNEIRHLTFVEGASHFYFTTPSRPSTVTAVFMPDPRGNWQRARKRFQSEDNDRKTGIAKELEFEGEIVGLANLSTELYVFRRMRARSQSAESFQVTKVEVDSELGFLPGDKGVAADLHFPSSPTLLEGGLKFSVIDLEGARTILIVSGIAGHPLCLAVFRRGDLRFEPLVLPDGLTIPQSDRPYSMARIRWPQVGRKGAKKSHKGQPNADSYRSVLAVAHFETGRIFEIDLEGTGPYLRELFSNSKDTIDVKPSSIDQVVFNTSDFDLKLQPLGQTLAMLLVGSQLHRRIWSFSDTSTPAMLPLIGGGTVPVDKYGVDNLLSYDIGPIDSVVQGNGSCIVFGRRDQADWGVLCFPQMVQLLEESPIDRESSGMKPSWNPADNDRYES